MPISKTFFFTSSHQFKMSSKSHKLHSSKLTFLVVLSMSDASCCSPDLFRPYAKKLNSKLRIFRRCYSGIMLDSLASLLCSKLCQHNDNSPIHTQFKSTIRQFLGAFRNIFVNVDFFFAFF